MMVQDNRDVILHMNLNVGATISRTKGFTRINPLEFHRLKVDEDP